MEQAGEKVSPCRKTVRRSTFEKEDQKMFKKFFATVKDEKGQALAEYGLILALIACVCILALTNLGTAVNAKLGEIVAAF
jgi:pilus assembly protein Flp/PilA